MADIKKMLDEAIEEELETLGNLPSDAKNKSEVIKNLAALHKLRMDEAKAEMEAEEKRERRIMDSAQHETDTQVRKEQQEAELALKERQADAADEDRDRDEQFKQRQLKDLAADRYVKIGVAAAELVLPLIFYGVWMKKGLKFEETGTYTSQTFKNLFNRFKPTKKS